jgi:hypothetical protein
VAPLEPWEKVLVDGDAFAETIHGKTECQGCHGGVQVDDKEAAHEGVVKDPSFGPDSQCSMCHAEQAEPFQTSLHASQAGYFTSMAARGADVESEPIQEMFGNHCQSCHTTCGDCHIAQPDSVGGGLIDGHVFKKTPSLTRNCTACHGSRVGDDYLGKHEDIPGDVHFRQGRMTCVACHDGGSLHSSATGEGDEIADHRYDGPQMPACVSCHDAVADGSDGVAQHTMHQDKLSCQVCHSVSYTNCDNCHVEISETSGKPFFSVEEHYLSFMIGRNPRQDENRPYEWVVLRHVPVAPDNYSFYGEDLTPDFDAMPTWVYTTPHNIQKNTPQNESCATCHGNADIFLTADKVKPEELEANRDVIVETVPTLK